MAILKIARMGHPILKKVAETVTDPTAPEVARLVDNMVETMLDAPGQGLAAPQVHVSTRIVVYIPPLPDDADSETPERKIRALVNPVLATLDDEMDDNWEGCLSVPGMMGAVPRHAAIRYRWQTLDGETMERQADGFHARAVQHECDHLDGILYPMRMDDLSLFGFADEVNRNKDLLARPNPEPEDEPEEERQEQEA